MATELLVQLRRPHYVAGVIVQDGTVVKSAPICAWMVGRWLGEVQVWVMSKGGELELVSDG